MHSISINNFGPLKNVELQPDKLTFFLGEQASGKSTIVKLLYFFRTLKDEFINLAVSSGNEDWFNIKDSYTSLLLKKFYSMFGDLKILGDFDLKYTYAESRYVTFYSYEEGKMPSFEFSQDLDKSLKIIWNDFKSGLLVNKKSAYVLQSSPTGADIDAKSIINALDNIFDEDDYEIYIPAGRAFLTHQSLLQLIQADEMKRINLSESSQYDVIDAPTRNFLYEVSRVRERYSNLNNVSHNGNIDNTTIGLLGNLMKKIIKGTYITDKLHDFILLSNQKNIKISYASSGQQEAIWLLNLLYVYAAEKRKCFVVIEEPEAHLHPEAQYMLVKFIAAFCNYTKSQMVVTTHSPYILSSFNNLIFAGKCGQTAPEDELDRIIPRESWTNPNEFSSYVLENGEMRSIKDDDLTMTDLAELDAVASSQDTEYEKMLSIYSRAR